MTPRIPADIHCAQDYERLAQSCLSGPSYAYIAGGAGRDQTAHANLDAFTQTAIYPRLLREMTQGHTRASVALS